MMADRRNYEPPPKAVADLVLPDVRVALDELPRDELDSEGLERVLLALAAKAFEKGLEKRR